MCNRYPNCDHAGPLVPKRPGIDRLCETPAPNHLCFYLRLGCKGCTFANTSSPPAVGSLSAMLLTRLVAAGLVTDRWAAQSADMLILRAQRQMVYNRLCEYIRTRSNDDDNPESPPSEL